MLRALWVPSTATVPAVPFVPAEKKMSSALVVVTAEVAMVPAELVVQVALVVLHVPVATPDPAVAPLGRGNK